MADEVTGGPEPQECPPPETAPMQQEAEREPTSTVRAMLLDAAETLDKRAQQQSGAAGRIRALVAVLDENPSVVPVFDAWAQDFFHER